MLRRERKQHKRDRLALQRYVALRMEEDIETSVRIVTRKARRMRKAAKNKSSTEAKSSSVRDLGGGCNGV
jgi:hypothetical protein